MALCRVGQSSSGFATLFSAECKFTSPFPRKSSPSQPVCTSTSLGDDNSLYSTNAAQAFTLLAQCPKQMSTILVVRRPHAAAINYISRREYKQECWQLEMGDVLTYSCHGHCQ